MNLVFNQNALIHLLVGLVRGLLLFHPSGKMSTAGKCVCVYTWVQMDEFSLSQYGPSVHAHALKHAHTYRHSNTLHGSMWVAGWQNLQPTELLSLGWFAASVDPKLWRSNSCAAKPDSSDPKTAWCGGGRAVLYCVDIFVCGSGKGFRYFDATHCQVFGFLNYVYEYKMDCRHFAVHVPTWQDN